MTSSQVGKIIPPHGDAALLWNLGAHPALMAQEMP